MLKSLIFDEKPNLFTNPLQYLDPLTTSMTDKTPRAQSACPADPQQNRRAKIICTIGPSCSTEAALRQLVQVGMDVARLNFSHGSHQDHARHIETLRRVAAEEDKTICI